MSKDKITGLDAWIPDVPDDGFFSVNREAKGTRLDFSPEAVAKRKKRDAEIAAEREARRIAEGRPCCCVDEESYGERPTCEHCYITNGVRRYWNGYVPATPEQK